jgi:hypothetical protein
MFSEWVEVEARCVVVFDGFRCVGKRELQRVNTVIEEWDGSHAGDVRPLF